MQRENVDCHRSRLQPRLHRVIICSQLVLAALSILFACADANSIVDCKQAAGLRPVGNVLIGPLTAISLIFFAGTLGIGLRTRNTEDGLAVAVSATLVALQFAVAAVFIV